VSYGRLDLVSRAPMLRLDRTNPSCRSAAQLVPLRAWLERNFEQCSPSVIRTASVQRVR
jgi:hypothetical protein